MLKTAPRVWRTLSEEGMDFGRVGNELRCMSELNTVDEWITNYVYLAKIGRAVMLLSGWHPGSK